jgi:hypothetical protein
LPLILLFWLQLLKGIEAMAKEESLTNKKKELINYLK